MRKFRRSICLERKPGSEEKAYCPSAPGHQDSRPTTLLFLEVQEVGAYRQVDGGDCRILFAFIPLLGS